MSEKQNKVFIETLGCAMNVRDSEHMLSELKHKANYIETLDPKEADLILINTCSVREKPERKLFSEIGNYAKIKKSSAKIGVCGCTASAMGESILKKSKNVNFVLGARNVSKIVEVLEKDKSVEVSIDFDDTQYAFAPITPTSHRALLNISIGCDKKCSYCIVPSTRGKEISIPLEILLNEVKAMAQKGVKEIMLLGQNVNNYGVRFSASHKETNFTELLREITAVSGIERVRFTSPHPLHMDSEFIAEFANNKKICKGIHIPLQSGSTSILRDMRRGYSKEWYLQKIEEIQKACKDAKVDDLSISTDIIVGYLGESDEDFAHTLDVLEKVRFDVLYSFIYSPRPNTLGGELVRENKELVVPAEIAQKRLKQLQNRHREIINEKIKNQIGREFEVLVDAIDATTGYSEGRNDAGRLVKISKALQIGQTYKVSVKDIKDGTLICC